jgi:hypothetical protein
MELIDTSQFYTSVLGPGGTWESEGQFSCRISSLFDNLSASHQRYSIASNGDPPRVSIKIDGTEFDAEKWGNTVS